MESLKDTASHTVWCGANVSNAIFLLRNVYLVCRVYQRVGLVWFGENAANIGMQTMPAGRYVAPLYRLP